MGNFRAEHLDFAAAGFPQQGGDLLGKVGAVVHHRQKYPVNLELGLNLPLHLVYSLEQLFQALGGQILRLDGDYDPVGSSQGVDREHPQGGLAVRIWEYCPLSVSRYCRRMVSRLMAFTRETSIPESWMSAGIRSTPSGWCRIPSPGRSGSSIRIRPIASDRVKGSLSGWGVAQADGQAALRVPVDQQHFFPGLFQPNSQVRAGGRFANAAFLVGDGDDLRVQ